MTATAKSHLNAHLLYLAGLIVLVLAVHGAFLTLLINSKLDHGEPQLVLILLGWPIVTSLTGAIGLVHLRRPMLGAALGGLPGPLFGWTYLDLFVHPPDWVDQESRVEVIAARVLIGCAIVLVVGAFVQVICNRLDAAPNASRIQRVRIGLQKGLGYTALCVAVSLPVLFLLRPTHTRIETLAEWDSRMIRMLVAGAVYSVIALVSGTAVSGLVGLMHASPATSSAMRSEPDMDANRSPDA